MTNKQINASFLPSIPNGKPQATIASCKKVYVGLGIVDGGVPGVIDISPGVGSFVRKQVLVRASDLKYEGNANDSGDAQELFELP